MKCPVCEAPIEMPEWVAKALDDLAKYITAESLTSGKDPVEILKERYGRP